MSMFSKQTKGKHAPGAAGGVTEEFATDDQKTQALPTSPGGDAEATQLLDPVTDVSDQATAYLGPIADDTIQMPNASAAASSGGRAEERFDGSSMAAIENIEPYAGVSTALPTRGKRQGAKAFIITFVVLAAVLAAVYVGIAMMFSTQFMPNTRVDGLDISMKKDDEVAQILQAIPEDYQIDVIGGNFSQRLTGEDVGMKLDAEALIAAMHNDQNPWYWPWYVAEASHDETYLLETTFDEDACNTLVKAAVKKYNKKAQPPTDASIFYNDKEQKFEIKSDEIGTQYNAKLVQKVVRDAVSERAEKVELTDEQLKQPKLLATDETIVNSVEVANGLLSTHLSLSIEGSVVDEIGSETLSEFIEIGDDFEVTLNEDELAAWVDDLASSYDTIGMERTYTRADGKQVTVSGGTYGWEVDEELLHGQIMDAIREGGSSEIDIPCIDSANMYAGRGERDWGNRYIDVDLTEQHARFYGDSGKIIWEADIITGAPDEKHRTPEGVWYIVTKQSPSKLVGYEEDGKTKDYEVEVTYWMPFVGNGIGFHDANWQPSFGGEMYAQGYGSHGCVNLAPSEAKELYNIIEPNDVVVVHS